MAESKSQFQQLFHRMLTIRTATAATVVAVQGVQEHRSAMPTLKIASPMTSALGLTTRRVVQGRPTNSSGAQKLLLTLQSDPNCGAAYTSAVDDTALGVADGCGQTNPSNSASAPSTEPVCS